MRKNFRRTMGLLVFCGLLMPAGMLFANKTYQPPSTTSNNSNWYDVEEASSLLNHLQDLAIKSKETIGPIKVSEIDLRWQGQATMLNAARSRVNKMANDLLRLKEMSSKVEPWQQGLIHKITPNIHEMAYQLDAAINTLNKYQLRHRLALTQYPQNLNGFCRNAGQVADTIGIVTQYAHAEEKMAELNKTTGTLAGS